tara:strand:- start:370 stop:597 length:228 start_codon:yes stop_codon:yes gene_type:complete
MKDYKKVTKEEFDKFVNEYPNKLDWNVTGICEPPLCSYNDFTNGKVWPKSMIAKVKMYDGSEYHGGRTKEYYIKS